MNKILVKALVALLTGGLVMSTAVMAKSVESSFQCVEFSCADRVTAPVLNVADVYEARQLIVNGRVDPYVFDNMDLTGSIQPTTLEQLKIGDTVMTNRQSSTFMGWSSVTKRVAYLSRFPQHGDVMGLVETDLATLPNLTLITTAHLPLNPNTLQIMYAYDFVTNPAKAMPSDVVVTHGTEQIILRKKS